MRVGIRLPTLRQASFVPWVSSPRGWSETSAAKVSVGADLTAQAQTFMLDFQAAR